MNMMLFNNSSGPDSNRTILKKGKSIEKFLDYYKTMPNISRVISDRFNETKLLQIYKDFIKVINCIVRDDIELPSCINDQRRKIVEYIEQYLFMELYPQ